MKAQNRTFSTTLSSSPDKAGSSSVLAVWLGGDRHASPQYAAPRHVLTIPYPAFPRNEIGLENPVRRRRFSSHTVDNNDAWGSGRHADCERCNRRQYCPSTASVSTQRACPRSGACCSNVRLHGYGITIGAGEWSWAGGTKINFPKEQISDDLGRPTQHLLPALALLRAGCLPCKTNK